MIPDFPEFKKQVQKELTRLLKREMHANAPMLRMVTQRILFEGDRMGVRTSDGKHRVNMSETTEGKYSYSEDELPDLKPEEFLGRVVAAGRDMGEQMDRRLIGEMQATVARTGNTIESNTGLSHSHLLAALEKLPVEFLNDDRSKPVMPSMVAHPDAVEGLMKAHEALTPADREAIDARQEKILDAKYEEHIAEVWSRKLID